jgi:hypothetical protein
MSLRIRFRKAETKREKLLLALAISCAFGFAAAFVFIPNKGYDLLKSLSLVTFGGLSFYGLSNSTMTPSKKQRN